MTRLPGVRVVGGGLAGCEAALQLANRGHPVELVEMRPVASTPAHQTDRLGELVCTNSFKSEAPANAHGQLKREMKLFGSVLLDAAQQTRVAAGSALAVDRRLFADRMTRAVEEHPDIELVRRELTRVPEGPTIIATGPLTSDALSEAIQDMLGAESLAFYDAIAPIVERDSIDESIAFQAGRFDEDSDYLNCPMNRQQYEAFVKKLVEADTYPGHDWEEIPYFEGCLPIEVMAARGLDTLRFGPMKPIGLLDPRTGGRPWAVVQLRREDRNGRMWNMVGFQTRLRTGEQGRVFRSVPGLARAEFLRWGSIHRNSYLNFPALLRPWGAPRERDDLLFAGQLTGVEGYVESAASGILAGWNMHRLLTGRAPDVPPPTTMLGGLARYLSTCDPERFQPMNSNWGLLDPLPSRIRDRSRRRETMADRAQSHLTAWLEASGTPGRTGAPASPARVDG